MDFSLDMIPDIIGHVIVDFINLLASVIQPVAAILPNPDPFPTIIDSLSIDGGSPGAIAYFYLNQFIDLNFIFGVMVTWFTMFGMAWLIQMLWNWAKLKNKG